MSVTGGQYIRSRLCIQVNLEALYARGFHVAFRDRGCLLHTRGLCLLAAVSCLAMSMVIREGLKAARVSEGPANHQRTGRLQVDLRSTGSVGMLEPT